MPIRKPSETCQKAAVSVSEMAMMLGLSRSRLYQLIDAGVFEPPIHDLRTRRPFFTGEIQRRNLLYRQGNIGADGNFHGFYRRRETQTAATSSRPSRRNSPPQEQHADLVAELDGLGVAVSGAQVNEAIRSLHPHGADGLDESELLREVFRYFRRSSSVVTEAS